MLASLIWRMVIKMIDDVIETYRCLLLFVKNAPDMRIEDALSSDTIHALEREYEWLKAFREERAKQGVEVCY